MIPGRTRTLVSSFFIALLLGGCAANSTRPNYPGFDDNTGDFGQVTSNKGAGDVYVKLAVAYMNEGRLDVALQKAKQAISVEPRNAEAHTVIALLYERLGELQLAEHHFKKGLDYQPKDSYLLNAYGSFLCKQQRFDEAHQRFQEALKNPLYKTPEVALTNAGICASRSSDQQKAETLFREALQRNPRFSMALLQMVRVSVNASEFLSARAYLQRFIEVSAHTASSLWLGIQAERELGDRNAVASYALLLKNSFPDSHEAQLLRESERQ